MADKRELILDLLARDKTAAGTAGAARNLDNVGTAAEKAGKKTETFGKATVVAGNRTEHFGKAARTAEGHVESLQAEIRKVDQDLVFLAASFAEASSAAERMDISKAIRRAEADLRKLNKSKSFLSAIIPETPDVGAAQSFGRKLMDGIGSGAVSVAGKAAGAPALVFGAAFGVAAAPQAAALFSAGISAAAGGGIMMAGIKLAAKDPVIAQTGKVVGSKFMKGLETEATQAFRGPLLSALDKLDAAGVRATKKLGKAFDSVAPHLEPLTEKVIQAGEAILGSLTRAAETSGPALDALGDGIVMVGDGISNFIDILSEGGPEAASNIRLISGIIRDVISVTGEWLGWLNKLSNHPWHGFIPILRKRYDDAAKSSDDLADKTSGLVEPMDSAARAAAGHREALSDLSKELRGQTDPVFGLLNAQDQLADAQRDAAEATKKHGRNSDEAKVALRKLAESALDLQGRVGALGGQFNGRMTPALRNTLRAAGLTEGQIKDLERQFRNAKTAADRYAKTYRATVVTTYKTVNVAPNNQNSGLLAGKGSVGRRASGGPVRKDTPYLVGENGPELHVPDGNGRIMSAAATRGMARYGPAMTNVGMSRRQALELQVVGQNEIVTFIRYLIRTANLIEVD